jgi:hypothetical protein
MFNNSLFLYNKCIFIRLDSESESESENWFDSFVEKGINKRDMDFKIFMREKLEGCYTFAHFKKLTRISHNKYEAHLEYVEVEGKIKRYWNVSIDDCGHILYIDKLYKYVSYDCVKRYYHEDLKKIDIEFEDSNVCSSSDEDEDDDKDTVTNNWCSCKEIMSALYEVIWR